jgi:tetratricopeptide (TPR) repeat protein
MSDQGPATPKVFGFKVQLGAVRTDPSAADRLLPWKEILEKGLAAHLAGQFGEAERLYRLVLEKDPKEPNALGNLGAIALQRGQAEQGVALIRASLAVKPNQPGAWSNLGNALTAQRRFDEAVEACERAVALLPQSQDAFNNLGNALSELGRGEEALAAYDRAITLKPDFAVALNNKGKLLRALGRYEESLAAFDQYLVLQDGADAHTERGNALAHLKWASDALAAYDQAIAADPRHAVAWTNKAVALQMLGRLEEAETACGQALALDPANAGAPFIMGNILCALDRAAQAVGYYERAIALRPIYPEAFNNLGNALQTLMRPQEALAAYERASTLRPDLAPAYANRGFMLRELGRFDEALAAYDRAVALDPTFLEALNNRGIVLNELRRLGESLAAFDQALAVDPAFADAAWNKALVLLLHERYARGWPLYEWRWRRADQLAHGMPFMPADWLKQAAVAGKTVRLQAEQGLGDTLQMLRYAPLLADMGARVTVAVQAPLAEIARSVRGVSAVIGDGEALPDGELRCMIMSLPFVFGTTVETIPAEIPYVKTTPEARGAWARRLGPRTRPRIGLAWSGSRIHPNDINRSIPLKALLPLLDADADFVSLQVEHREADEALLRADGRIRRFDGEISSFMDTAALIEQLDLVIAVDTSVAHMAGALGRPVWLMLARTPDFRWHLGREDSPWYPSARLFRQSAFGDWDGVVLKAREALTALLFGS